MDDRAALDALLQQGADTARAAVTLRTVKERVGLLACNCLGDGLRDILDPRLRGATE